MIKFFGIREGRPMIGIGLSRGNCKKLIEGKPIFIDLKVMLADANPPPDLNDATLFVFGGETEATMERQLRKLTDGRPAIHKHHEEN
jgi:hypothetical protein